MNSRAFLPGIMVAALLLLVVLPVLRARLRHGVEAFVVFESRRPIHRLADGWMMCVELAWLAWTFVYWLAEPKSLGIFVTPAWVAPAGWGVALSGAALTGVAQAQMGAAFRIGIGASHTMLVTGGLFAHSRNPIFAAVILSFAGIGIVTLSPWSIMGTALTVAVFQLQSRLEEEHLVQTHGDAYRQYAARTGRFLPRIGRIPSR